MFHELIGMGISALSSLTGAGEVGQGYGDAIATNKESLATSKEMRDQSLSNYTPFQEAGQQGLEGYQAGIGNLPQWGGFSAADMQQDPGYQFRLDQGYQGLDRMSARAGNRFSGQRGIGLMNYGQQMASQEFGAARNRSISDYGMQRQEGLDTLGQNLQLANMGFNTAGALGNINTGYSNQVMGINSSIAGNQVGRAQASASGVMGVGNAINSGLGAMQYQNNFNQYMQTLGGQQNTPLSGYSAPAYSGDAYMPAFQRR